MAKDTDCGVCFVRSASCAAYGISENLCGVCEGADWQHCANEGGWCTCKGRVRFGEGSNWADESNSQGQMFCTSTKFDKDPSVGKAKTCQCAHGESYMYMCIIRTRILHVMVSVYVRCVYTSTRIAHTDATYKCANV